MTLELAGFIIGIIGAIWMKISVNLLNQEKNKPEIAGIPPGRESPALRAFIKGLTLILIGLGIETFTRLFLN